MTRRDAKAPAKVALALIFSCIFAGCGRPATVEDCNKVVEKNVEVQLKKGNITDPGDVEREKVRVKASLSDKIAQCPGRRITDGMMRCVDQAETSEQIDKCLHRLF
jgi:hypothetical protein